MITILTDNLLAVEVGAKWKPCKIYKGALCYKDNSICMELPEGEVYEILGEAKYNCVNFKIPIQNNYHLLDEGQRVTLFYILLKEKGCNFNGKNKFIILQKNKDE